MRSIILKGNIAFTLIELLVVVAIILLLAAILLPSLQTARESGKRAACLEHLRQVSLGLFLMADENNGWINGTNAAYTASNDSWVSPPYYWMYAVTNYLGKSAVLVEPGSQRGCPSRDRRDVYYQYGANVAFAGNGPTPMRSLREVIDGARVFLVADSYVWFPGSYTHFDYTVTGGGAVGSYARHKSQGLNFVFVDGHGQFLKDQVWRNTSIYPGPVRWSEWSFALFAE